MRFRFLFIRCFIVFLLPALVVCKKKPSQETNESQSPEPIQPSHLPSSVSEISQPAALSLQFAPNAQLFYYSELNPHLDATLTQELLHLEKNFKIKFIKKDLNESLIVFFHDRLPDFKQHILMYFEGTVKYPDIIDQLGLLDEQYETIYALASEPNLALTTLKNLRASPLPSPKRTPKKITDISYKFKTPAKKISSRSVRKKYIEDFEDNFSGMLKNHGLDEHSIGNLVRWKISRGKVKRSYSKWFILSENVRSNKFNGDQWEHFLLDAHKLENNNLGTPYTFKETVQIGTKKMSVQGRPDGVRRNTLGEISAIFDAKYMANRGQNSVYYDTMQLKAQRQHAKALNAKHIVALTSENPLFAGQTLLSPRPSKVLGQASEVRFIHKTDTGYEWYQWVDDKWVKQAGDLNGF